MPSTHRMHADVKTFNKFGFVAKTGMQIHFDLAITAGEFMSVSDFVRPALVDYERITGYIRSDGRMYDTPAKTAAPYDLNDPGELGVELLSNDPDLNLETDVAYHISLELPGWNTTFASFYITGLPVDDTAKNLADFSPGPGHTVTGDLRGAVGPKFAGLVLVGASSVQPMVESPDGDVPAGDPVDLSAGIEAAVTAADIHGQVVAEVAASATVTDAAAAAVESTVGPAVDALISGILNDETSDIRNFFDVRYAPYSLAATIGDGFTTVFNVPHPAFDDVMVQLRLVDTNELVMAKVVALSTSVTQVSFAVAPATDSIRVMIQPIGDLVEIADSEPPTAPSNLFAEPTLITGSSVSLTWDAATDNVGIVFYTVYRADGLGAAFASATVIGSNGVTRAYTDTTVEIGSDYTYFVTATDYSLNEGPASAGEDVTTPAFAGINPATYVGLVSNFEPASLALADGAAIASWTPSAGSKSTALVQATGANQPHFVANAKNGLPGVDFDGSDLLRLSADDWSITKGVIYGVMNATALASSGVAARNLIGFGTYASWGTTARYVASLYATGNFGAGFGGAGMQAGAVITAGTWYAFVAKFMGGTNGYKLWLNNTTATPTTTGGSAAISGAVNTLLVGSNTGAFQWLGKSTQLGVISCDSAETPDADCGAICEYLMSKYAIAA